MKKLWHRLRIMIIKRILLECLDEHKREILFDKLDYHSKAYNRL